MRVLVVDDEIYTREGIIESVDWESLGVEEVLDADDGLSALSIADWFYPDIVISDVKMPQMDGIAFAQQFLERFPESKIIFMSAYLEIHYYQQAIKLSAVDYVEKPLDMEEMKAAIKKAISKILDNRENQEGKKKSKIVLEEQVANYLINPRRNSLHCQELCQQVGFPIEGEYIALSFKDLEKEDDRQQIVSMIDEFFNERGMVCITSKNDGYYYSCLLAMNGIARERYSIHGLGLEFTNQYPSFQIGLGVYTNQLDGISESLRCSKDALNQAFYEPQETVFEREQQPEDSQMVDSGIYSRVNYTMVNEPEKLQMVVNTVFMEFEQKKQLSPSSVKSFAKAIVMDILRQEENADVIREEIFWGQAPEEYIENCESLDEVHQVLSLVAGKLLGAGEYAGLSSVVKSVCRYIKKYYHKPDLGLAEIAEECGISTGYLSIVFKKEMGITVRQFIETCRIEAAKDKLIHTNERVQDISVNSGFAQQGYFSRVFKQKTGLTPAEFREKHYV